MWGKNAAGKNQQEHADGSGRTGGGQAGGSFPFPLISIAAAFAISGILLYFGCQSVEAETADRSWDVVATGDSIIGKTRGESSVDDYFKAYSGLSMLNGAFGGNCASAGDGADRYSYNEESLNLYQLAEAVAYRDFGVQWADLAASRTKMDYFNEVMAGLAAVDFRQTRVLLLAFGTNDYLSGRKMDNPDDPFDKKTYGGALRYAVELIKTAYPDLQVVLVTPPFCHISDQKNCLEQRFGGGTLDKYVEVEKKVAAQYGLYVVDAFDGLGIDEGNYETYLEPGGLHLNQAGRELYAHFLAKEIKKILREEGK